MTKGGWPTRRLAIASLHLDAKNPRLGRETTARAPRDIIEYLFKHDKAFEVAQSIAARGYFPNEPLLAIKEHGRYVVVEGNRRLAALKALREPGVLESPFARRVERLAKRLDLKDIAEVSVTIAPDRRSTDKLLAGRHIGTPVLPWQQENRASFILDKLAEGYTNDQLRDELGFTEGDIQEARQTRAIAEMARSIELPDEVRAKLDNPRAKIFTTIGRVFESTIGRDFMRVKPDQNNGLRGTTTKKEFVRGFTKLVTDVALGKASSRTLNTNEDIERYFNSWRPNELPADKQGSFIPADVINDSTVSSAQREPEQKRTRSRRESKSVIPKDLKVRYGNDRLIEIRGELASLDRTRFPNAGAVLLRVFFELAVIDYLKRVGSFDGVVAKLQGQGKKLRYGTPTLNQLVPEITRIAKQHLKAGEATQVEKAIKYDSAAPFSLADLHSFVHQASDIPGERDIKQFWLRTEPLFRLMLEKGLPK